MGTISQHKIRRKRLSEQLTAQLRKYIVDHDLKPGDPLLTEQQMVERFGVSHTVVREATKASRFLGIIDAAAPRHGPRRIRFRSRQRVFRLSFCLERLSQAKTAQGGAVIETGALFYTMEAMKEDPALYPQLRKLAEALPTRTTLMVGGLSTTSPFIGGWFDASDISPLASFCDLLQAFFHKFREDMGDVPERPRKPLPDRGVLWGGDLEAATKLLRNHLSFYERNVSP